MQLGKKRDEVHQVYSKGVNVSELSSFLTTSPNFGPFPKVYFNQKYNSLRKN